MPTLEVELLSLFTDVGALRPALVAEFVKWTESGERSKIEEGRWNLAVGVGCDSRILLPDIWLPVRETLWTARLELLRQARTARRWGDVSQLAYELRLLAPDRVAELALDDDAFAALDFELPSVFEHQSGFLARAYQLAVLYPNRRPRSRRSTSTSRPSSRPSGGCPRRATPSTRGWRPSFGCSTPTPR